MIIGKAGQEAYLDSREGLVPCVVRSVHGRTLVVDFPEDGQVLHWSGMTRNAWKGRTGESFPDTRIVPRTAVHGHRITPYRWQPSPQ